jgi:exonuclease III
VVDNNIVTSEKNPIEKKTLSVYFQNVHGLRTKTQTYFLSIIENPYDVFVFAETNLMPGINTGEIFTNEYIVFRCDRALEKTVKKSGGGVLIAIKSSLQCNLIDNGSIFENIELVCVKIHQNESNIFLCGVYIPPTSTADVYDSFCSFINNKVIKKCKDNDRIVIVGDFNLPALRWRSDLDGERCFFPENVSREEETALIDGMLSLNLFQINGTPNSNNHMLDLVFTNDTNLTNTYKALPLDKYEIHHFAIGIEIEYILFCEQLDFLPEHYFNFKHADYDAIKNSIVQFDWNSICLMHNSLDNIFDFDFNSLNENLNNVFIFEMYQAIHNSDDNVNNVNFIDFNVLNFYCVLYSIIFEFVPVAFKNNYKYPKWFTKHLINLLDTKDRAQDALKNSRNARSESDFDSACRAFQQLHRSLYNGYVERISSDILSNPSAFWSFIDYKKKNNVLPSSMVFGDAHASGNAQICKLFSDYFKSVYKKSTSFGPSIVTADNSNAIGDIVLSESEVLDALLSLDCSKGAGPDEIPSIFLKNCARELASPLTVLFNLSLKFGYFPSIWKFSHVIPVFKSGSKDNIENYRGISILSCVPKLFESIVNKLLFSRVKGCLSVNQHGFFKNRSIVSNLVEFSHKTIVAIESGLQMDCAYTDFSKAFDILDHGIILKDFYGNECFQIAGSLLNWIASYLSDRFQYVKINSSKSEPFMVTSGVPQGSHLGPLIFLMLINKVGQILFDVGFLIYADDLKIFKVIRTLADCHKLQSVLDAFHQWCFQYKLVLNVRKCNIMSFSRKIDTLCYDYNFDGAIISRPDSIKDLGIVFDRKMTFDLHINYVVSRSMSMLGFVKRFGREFSDPYVLKTIYCAFVRSVLEYGSCIWSPNFEVHKRRIESVQRKFLRFALRDLGWSDPFNLPAYEDRCKLLNLQTLANRRDIFCSMFIHDLIGGIINSPFLFSVLAINSPVYALRNYEYIRPEFHRTTYGQNEPITYAISRFNAISDIYSLDLSRNEFKKKLSEHFL